MNDFLNKNNLTQNDVIEYLKGLDYKKFSEIVKEYSAHTSRDYTEEMRKLASADLQERLSALHINDNCPKCFGNSGVIKSGIRNGIQYYKCKSCNQYFTRFSNTILEKSHYHWDIWVQMMYMVLNDISIPDMLTNLEKDYGLTKINSRTVWLMRMKIVHAIASLSTFQLSGVVQIDETFIRESQKGSRHLESVFGDEKRRARKGRCPSQLGIMGLEFASVITAIDGNGFCICKVASLGKTSDERFEELFDEYIKKASFICSDANKLYKRYCNKKGIPHYIKPSNYQKILDNNGYLHSDKTTLSYTEMMKWNAGVKKKAYEANIIDYIDNMGHLSYEEFNEIKETNHLSLAKANELHSDIKLFINKTKTNVSTKYLADYMGYFCFIRNWKVVNGHYPKSKTEAEELLMTILQEGAYFSSDTAKRQEIEAPIVSPQYVGRLRNATAIIRYAQKDNYIKFGAEDGVDSFNLKKYLTEMPIQRVLIIAQKCKISQYKDLKKTALIKQILKHPDCELIIFKDILDNREYIKDDEDILKK